MPGCAIDSWNNTGTLPVGERGVMSRLRFYSIAISLDGFMPGIDQDIDHPLGVGGARLHDWIVATRSFREMTGQRGSSDGVDDDVVRQGFDGIGATIMGRKVFGPVRGPWADDDWKGWWGETPPFHHPRVRAHARAPFARRDGRWHDVPLRDRWHRISARSGPSRGGRPRCPTGGRSGDSSSVPGGQAGR